MKHVRIIIGPVRALTRFTVLRCRFIFTKPGRFFFWHCGYLESHICWIQQLLLQHKGCHALLCTSRNTGQINPTGFQSLKYMYYIHVIMIIKWFWLDLTWLEMLANQQCGMQVNISLGSIRLLCNFYIISRSEGTANRVHFYKISGSRFTISQTILIKTDEFLSMWLISLT